MGMSWMEEGMLARTTGSSLSTPLATSMLLAPLDLVTANTTPTEPGLRPRAV